MEKWIHCNKCARRNVSSPMYLLECSHVICDKCLLLMRNSGQCVVCQKEVGYKEINNDLDQSLQSYFRSFQTPMQPQLNIINFQFTQKNSLLQHLMQKISALKKEIQKVQQSCKNIAEENKSLKQTIVQIHQCTKMSPCFTSDNDSPNTRRNKWPGGAHRVGRPQSNQIFGSVGSHRSNISSIPSFMQSRGSRDLNVFAKPKPKKNFPFINS